MKRHYYLLIFLCLGLNCYAQENKYNIPVLMDINYTGVKYLYDKPDGRVIHKLAHDIKDEDYIVLTILDKSDTMFYINAEYSFKGYIGSGWIKKDKTICIYSRAYNNELNLYKAPNYESGIQCTIPKYNPGLYTVTDCDDKWLRVNTYFEGKYYEGWLAPNMQCANPYSTCS